MADANWYTNHESSLKAKNIHSINIFGYNTWDDWFLIPASRPVVNPPSKKRVTVDVFGGDGVLDESETLRKYPTYSVRQGSWTFYVDNDHGSWEKRYSDISDAIHGLTGQVSLDDDPSWYYSGLVSINEWQSNKDRSSIVMDYEFYPYKLSYVTSTDEDWLWDPFNFETDWIYSKPGYGLNEYPLNSANNWAQLTYGDRYFGRKPISPTIIVSNSTNGILLRLDNPELQIAKEDFYHWEQTTKVPGILIPNNSGLRISNFILSTIKETNQNTIYLKGVGTISFDFRVGRL